jgi:hypothetical protein
VAAKITVSLEVPIEWNDLRKKYNVTWRDIIKQGFNTMDPAKDQATNPTTASAQLKIAVEAIMRAHNIIKGKNTP